MSCHLTGIFCCLWLRFANFTISQLWKDDSKPQCLPPCFSLSCPLLPLLEQPECIDRRMTWWHGHWASVKSWREELRKASVIQSIGTQRQVIKVHPANWGTLKPAAAHLNLFFFWNHNKMGFMGADVHRKASCLQWLGNSQFSWQTEKKSCVVVEKPTSELVCQGR